MSYDCNYPIVPDCEVRDLGVLMNNNGDYNTHVTHICNKANKRAGWILRTFFNRSPDFMRFVWKTYISPIVDYCSQMYAPVKGSQLQKLENILRTFTKKSMVLEI